MLVSSRCAFSEHILSLTLDPFYSWVSRSSLIVRYGVVGITMM